MAVAGGLIVVQSAKLVLHAAMATEVTVPSLQGIALPLGFTVNTVQGVELGRRIDRVVGSGAVYDEITMDANFVKGDPTRLEIEQAAVNNTAITDMRFYSTNCDFAALDLINDPTGYYQFGSCSAPSGAKSEILTRTISVLPSGSSLYFETHKTGIQLDFTANAGVGVPSRVAASGSDFVTLGFEAGMTLILSHVDGGDPMYVQAESVAAGLIIFTEDVGDEATVPTFTGIATTKVSGAQPIEVNDFAEVCS